MRPILYILFFALLVPNISCAANHTAPLKKVTKPIADNKQNNVSNRILVRFKPGTDKERIKIIQDKLGLVTVKVMKIPDLYLMESTKNTSVNKIIESLKDNDDVLYAEPDYKYKKDDK